jgi:hypothetical protein
MNNPIDVLIFKEANDNVPAILDTAISIKTSDFISWSLQIARGMEFLASKKVTGAIC